MQDRKDAENSLGCVMVLLLLFGVFMIGLTIAAAIGWV